MANLQQQLAQIRAQKAAGAAPTPSNGTQPTPGAAPQQYQAGPDLQAQLAELRAKKNAPVEEPKKEGFIKSTVKSIVRPVVELGVTGAAALEDAVNLTTGNMSAKSRTKTGYNVPGFGQVIPHRIGTDIEIKKDEQTGKETMTGGGLGKDTLRVLGTGAELASMVAGGGSAGTGVKALKGVAVTQAEKLAAEQAAKLAAKEVAKKTVFGNLVKTPLRAAITEGAIGGATQGFGSSIKEDDATAGSVLASTLGGGVLGGAAGAVIPVLGGAVKKGFGRMTGQAPSKAALVERELLEAGMPDARVATKTLTPEGKIITDKAAKEVIRQGIPEADVALMRSGSLEDKKDYLKMLGIRQSQMTNKRVVDRATDVVGNTFIDDYARPLEKLNRDAATQLDTVARSLAGKKVDPSPAVTNFGMALENSGVTITPGGKLKFTGSDFEGLKSIQTQLNTAWNRARRVAKSGDALQTHRLKSYIDQVVGYGKSADGLTGKAEAILKGLRHDADGVLDATFPRYNKVNTKYADTIRQLDQMSAAIGKKFKPGDSFADAQAGLAMRRILSNTNSRADILKLLSGMQEVGGKYGLKFKKDIIGQANFADVLEKMLGSEAPTSFLGQGERFADGAEKALGALGEFGKGNVVGGTLKAGKYALDLTRGVTQENKINALRALLEQEVGATRRGFGKAIKTIVPKKPKIKAK